MNNVFFCFTQFDMQFCCVNTEKTKICAFVYGIKKPFIFLLNINNFIYLR